MDRTQLLNNLPDNTTGVIQPANIRDIVTNAILPEDLVAGTNTILDKSALPTITISAQATYTTIANQAARLALTATVGAYAYQSDLNHLYLLSATPASTNANWHDMGPTYQGTLIYSAAAGDDGAAGWTLTGALPYYSNGDVWVNDISVLWTLATVHDHNLCGFLDVAGSNIQTLDCHQGGQASGLIGLNVSFCGYLTTINASSNSLTSLDITTCPNLTTLKCKAGFNNGLTTLDLSKAVVLQWLDVDYQGLTTLDITNCGQLAHLECSGNSISTWESSACPLTYLDVSGNQLSSLDISGNNLLTYLNCSGNGMGSVDAIIIALAGFGLHDGTLHCQDNTAPTSAATSGLATLTANGWTITHD